MLRPLTPEERERVLASGRSYARFSLLVVLYRMGSWRNEDCLPATREVWVTGAERLIIDLKQDQPDADDLIRRAEAVLEEIRTGPAPSPPPGSSSPSPSPPSSAPPPPVEPPVELPDVPSEVLQYLRSRKRPLDVSRSSFDRWLVDILSAMGFGDASPTITADASESFLDAFEAMEPHVERGRMRGVGHVTLDRFEEARREYDALLASMLAPLAQTPVGEWNDPGPLKLAGYTVDRSVGLTVSERRRALRLLIRGRLDFLRDIDRQLHRRAGEARSWTRRSWIMGYLKMFIARAGTRRSMRRAIALWSDDLEWMERLGR